MAWKVDLCAEAEAELLEMPTDIRAQFLHIVELLEASAPKQVGMPISATWRAICGRCARGT